MVQIVGVINPITKVIDKCSTIENAVYHNITNKETAKKSSNEEKDDIKEPSKNKKTNTTSDAKKGFGSKKNVTWVGTSLSNVLDRKKFEKDCNVKLNMVKAYCIDVEDKALYKEANFKKSEKRKRIS